MFWKRYERISVLALLSIFLITFAAPATAERMRQETGLPDEPEIGARSAIVVEYPSGRILYAKAAHDRLAPASTTKILTAILAIEYGNMDDVVRVAGSDLVGESSMGLVEGEEQSFKTLLYGLMLPSGNDAAMAIARALGEKAPTREPELGSPVYRFVAMMNSRVAQLGLEDSHFANPSGLDAAGHYSTAYDLASLTWYAFHMPEFNTIVSRVTYDAPGHSLLNTNELLTRYSGADGVKTGLTDAAGLCLVGSATRDGKRLISVVLNAPRWYADTTAILDYGYARLAAQPGSDGEQLAVSTRGAVSWLLAGEPVPASDGVQGGGLVPPQSSGPVVNPAPNQPDFSPIAIAPATAESGGTVWALGLFALTACGCALLFSRRLRGFGLRFRGSRVVSSTLTRFETVGTPLTYTVTESEGLGTRRRAPNLFESDKAGAAHIARAVQLALEEREGSSMGEFLLALRENRLFVADLASQFRLPPTAFLALARAQTALGHYEDARATLLHGVTVFPHHRILSLALHQLAGEPTL